MRVLQLVYSCDWVGWKLDSAYGNSLDYFTGEREEIRVNLQFIMSFGRELVALLTKPSIFGKQSILYRFIEGQTHF